MKKLSAIEQELVAGGADTELLDPVPGWGNIPPGGGETNPTGGFDGDGNGGSGGSEAPNGGGGSGSEGSPSAPVVYRHVTPSGHQFSTRANLSSAQESVASQIIDYGSANEKRNDYIAIAVRRAFQETSFNTILTNPTHFGLYQFSASTWSERHPGLDINNMNDQIKAMFNDIDRYAERYRSRREAGEIPDHIMFEQYVEYKHHYGSNYDKWEPELLDDFNKAYQALGLNEG